MGQAGSIMGCLLQGREAGKEGSGAQRQERDKDTVTNGLSKISNGYNTSYMGSQIS